VVCFVGVARQYQVDQRASDAAIAAFKRMQRLEPQMRNGRQNDVVDINRSVKAGW
jgi:hypothetical protein